MLSIRHLIALTFLTVFTSSSFAAVTVDATVSAVTRSANNLTSPQFSTTTSNELILAMISADRKTGGGPNMTVLSLTGANLTWNLVKRVNVRSGTAEIWKAFAPNPLTRVTVKATLANKAAASITVVSFAGVDTSGTNGSAAIGAIAGESGTAGSPTAPLITTRDGSLVFAVANDSSRAIAIVPVTGQSLVHQYLTSSNTTHWVQKLNAAVPSAGTQVVVSDTTPVNDAYNIAAVEIRAAPVINTFTISGSISPAASAAGTVMRLSGDQSATAVADASGAYSFPDLPNGNYTVTPTKEGFIFNPSSETVAIGNGNIGTVNFSALSNIITQDVSVSTNPSTSTQAIDSPAFSTRVGQELLLAFIATGKSTAESIQVQNVSGAGLTWTLVNRVNTAPGTTEIWKAYAPSTLSNVTVTATLTEPAAASMTVMSFINADISSEDGSSAIGNTSFGNGSTGAPTAWTNTTRNNSLVLAVGNDSDQAVSRLPGSGQEIVNQSLAISGNTFWVQKITSPVAVGGTQVTVNDTSTSSNHWNLNVVEVIAANNPVYTISGNFSPNGAGAIVTWNGMGSSGVVTADANGNYSIKVGANGTYTLLPSAPRSVVSPVTFDVSINSASQSGINFSTTAAPTGSAFLTWTAPIKNSNGTANPDIAGYNVYYGTSPGNYMTALDAGNVTYFRVTGLAPGTYYFVVTAYSSTDLESAHSNEASLDLSLKLTGKMLTRELSFQVR